MDLPHKLNFVIHDWGSGLGFHWCNLNRDRVQSITYMEALVSPIPTWNQFPEQSRAIFQAMRSDKGLLRKTPQAKRKQSYGFLFFIQEKKL